MKVLHVCSELYPLLKTGGLADVTGALPFAQKKLGIDARVVIPGYPAVVRALPEGSIVAHLETFAGWVTIRYVEFKGIGMYIIDAPHLYEREGNPYYDGYYNDYGDNVHRFALLAWVGSQLANNLDTWWNADVVHSHDWHAGLTSAYLKAMGSHAKSIFTIHNIAFQGCFDYKHMYEINLPIEMFHVDGLELNGQISFLKAGLYFSDHVTTVSPTYALEITQPEYAYGLQGLLTTLNNEHRLTGILNGVDEDIWNPETDSYLQKHYKVKATAGKKVCKAHLQETFGLPVDSNALLMVMVTRLTVQKGVDLLLETLPQLLSEQSDIQFILLGSGDSRFEEGFKNLASVFPEQVAIHIGYDEGFSHLVIAGGDVILVPSRFEPCGLTQLYGLKYGTLPFVRSTGGLADTVVDSTRENMKLREATGFVFNEMSVEAMLDKFTELHRLWLKPQWYKIRIDAMKQDFSWNKAAKEYIALYQSLL